MQENCPSGSTSGVWKRSMAELARISHSPAWRGGTAADVGRVGGLRESGRRVEGGTCAPRPDAARFALLDGR